MRLQEKAEKLASRGLGVGGPVADFEKVGRLQLIALLRAGLNPDSKVVDIGCGCLRGGYWLIHFLDPDCYCGIEPSVERLEAGKTEILEPDVLEAKRPRFDTNDDFDTSVFGEQFDFFLARSIWTHASKPEIARMLDSFVRDTHPAGGFLTSYLPARGFRPPDYRGDSWTWELVRHSIRWVRQECSKRGLSVTELKEEQVNQQVWLRIARVSEH